MKMQGSRRRDAMTVIHKDNSNFNCVLGPGFVRKMF